MIYVDRRKVKTPNVLTGEKSKGKKEKEKNIVLAKANKWKKVKHSVYRLPEVRETLTRLFHGKCAYCESRFIYTYPGDIEHFRPKDKIEEADPQTPGYYWLAADWENLLFSCRNCNQHLKHDIPGIKEKVTRGKMAQFPLRGGIKHIQSYDEYLIRFEEEENNRLLINPCKDNPEEYFRYEISGSARGMIKPKAMTGKINEMAQKSIEVFALQRLPLVQEREKLLISISVQQQRVVEAANNLNDCLTRSKNKDKRMVYEIKLRRELNELRTYTEEDKEYAGMARQIVEEFMKNFI